MILMNSKNLPDESLSHSIFAIETSAALRPSIAPTMFPIISRKFFSAPLISFLSLPNNCAKSAGSNAIRSPPPILMSVVINDSATGRTTAENTTKICARFLIAPVNKSTHADTSLLIFPHDSSRLNVCIPLPSCSSALGQSSINALRTLSQSAFAKSPLNTLPNPAASDFIAFDQFSDALDKFSTSSSSGLLPPPPGRLFNSVSHLSIVPTHFGMPVAKS